MARRNRQYSQSGIYHVILRGVNRQNIFYDDMDRRKMLHCLKRYADETDVVIIAYCLMDNHIHLLLETGTSLSLFIKKLASGYVYYFNHKYGRVGHLFQDRFRSEPVESDNYFLTVFRYILQNPEKAGICPAEQYKWSSWQELVNGQNLCHFDRLTEMIGGHEQLLEFVSAENDDECLEDDSRRAMTDVEALVIIQNITGEESPLAITALPRNLREHMIAEIRKAGVSLAQISRITGLTKGVIQAVKL